MPKNHCRTIKILFFSQIFCNYKARFLWVLAIKYEFDQHNDIYFQNLWPIGSPEPLTVKSEKSGFWRNKYTGWPKIWSRKYKNHFFTPKIWPIDSDVDQQTKSPSFVTYLTKINIFMVILYHFGEAQFSMIQQVFLVLTCSKRWQFCVLISANVHVLLGHKIIYVLHRPYFGTPCITVYPKTGLFWFHC